LLRMARKYERAEWFEKAVAQRLLLESTETGRRAGLVRGSSAGVKCLRRLAYPIFGYEPMPNDADNCWTLGLGNAVHDWIQLKMAEWGIVNAEAKIVNHQIVWTGDCEGNVLDKEHGITGHYDGLTVTMDNGLRYLLEFKTKTDKAKVQAVFIETWNDELCTVKYVVPVGMSAFSQELPRLQGSPPKPLSSAGNEEYQRIAEQMGLVPGCQRALVDVVVKPGSFSSLSTPDAPHVAQASWYAKNLGADQCLVIYLAKEMTSSYDSESLWNVPVKAFSFAPDLKAAGEFEARAKEVWRWIERRELPPPGAKPDDGSMDCLYCNFKHLCWPENPKVKEYTARAVRELSEIGRELSDAPWVTHSEAEVGALLKDEVK